MKNRRNSLRQIIESTVNAWCCCDTQESELERKYKTLLNCFKEASEECAELRQEILGHEMALDIEMSAVMYAYKSSLVQSEELHKIICGLADDSEKRRIQLIVVSAALFAVSVLAMVETCGGVA